MPTNSSPSGRWLTGGLMMPPPDIGPRAPCANSGAAESMSKRAAAPIDLAKLLLLRTAFSFSSYPAGAVASYHGIASAMLWFVSWYRFSDTANFLLNALFGAGFLLLRCCSLLGGRITWRGFA